jgi:hypothetical protein
MQWGERHSFVDSLLVRIHNIIVMIRWAGFAPWEFEFPFSGTLTSTFLEWTEILGAVGTPESRVQNVARMCGRGRAQAEVGVEHQGVAEFSVQAQLLHRNVQRFQGGLVFQAHRPLYHSTLGLRVTKKRRRGVPSSHRMRTLQNVFLPSYVWISCYGTAMSRLR